MASGALALRLLFGVAAWAGEKPVYENSFEKAKLGELSDEFLVLNGAFEVKEEGGNKFLEMPGAPVDAFGLLFGPTLGADVSVAARVFGTGKGRRAPTFAVGLNGVGGYKLQVSPAKKALEILKGDDVKASIAFEWKDGAWTHLRLQMRKVKDGAWTVEGKAWTQGSPEPATWTVTWEEKEAPAAGRASIWGSPYSGTPIRFDDLSVMKKEN